MTRLFDLESGVPGVRLATKADEGEIFALLLMLHAENSMFGLNPDKVLCGIQWATERKGGVIYVIEDNGRIVASLGMTIAADWYSDDEYLMERWNFVHPDYRKSDYARKLLEQGKWSYEWFKAKTGKQMPFQCGINSFDRTEAKIRLYARHMPCIGAYFMYGEPPRPVAAEKARAEVANVEAQIKKAKKERTREVRPVVETILRLSRQHAAEGQVHVHEG